MRGFDRGVRLGDPLFGLVDGALRHHDVLFGFADRRLARIERGLRGGRGRDGGIVLLPGNLVLVHQQLVARHVVAGFLEVRFRLADLGVRGFQAGLRAALSWRSAPSTNAAASARPEFAVFNWLAVLVVVMGISMRELSSAASASARSASALATATS